MGGWKTDWASDSDDSAVGLPPPHYNAEAERNRELDLSNVWEPAALKVVSTPFTYANQWNRARQQEEKERREKTRREAVAAATATKSTAVSGGSRGREKVQEKAPTLKQKRTASQERLHHGREAETRDGDDEEEDADSEEDSGDDEKAEVDSEEEESEEEPPTPPPVPKKPKRRGPVPAKSSRLFATATETEQEEKLKMQERNKSKQPPARRWTKAELDGWKDADGNPVPAKKSSASSKNQPSLVDMLNKPAGRGKKGAGAAAGKGKGQGGVKNVVHVPAVGAGVSVPEDIIGNVEGGAKGKKKAASKKKGEGEDELAETGAKKGKTATTTGGDAKGKGKGKAAGSKDEIKFSRLPAGAAPTADYPILQGIERLKALPTRSDSASTTTTTKARTKGGRGKKIPTIQDMLAETEAKDRETSAMLDALLGIPPKQPEPEITIDRLLPSSTLGTIKRKRRASDGSQSSLDSLLDPGQGRRKTGETGTGTGTAEGKKVVPSRYFNPTSRNDSGKASQPDTLVASPRSKTLDPPTITKLATADGNLDLSIENDRQGSGGVEATAESSSVLPYSSPAEDRSLRKHNSTLVHPQPMKAADLPNAKIYERLAAAAAARGEEAKAREEKERGKKIVPDVSSFMRKGFTHARPPMNTNRSRRPRSPQSKIDDRYHTHSLQPQQPNINPDNFRSPAYIRQAAERERERQRAQQDIGKTEDGEWSTLEQKGKKGKNRSSQYDADHGWNGGSGGGGGGLARGSGLGLTSTGAAMTTSQMPKKASLFTPQAPAPAPPSITVEPPKFRITAKQDGDSGGGALQRFGAVASTQEEEEIFNPYKRKTTTGSGSTMGIAERPRYQSNLRPNNKPVIMSKRGRESSSPVEGTLVGKYGAYTVQPQPQQTTRRGVEERPRYMPSVAVWGDHSKKTVAKDGGGKGQIWDPSVTAQKREREREEEQQKREKELKNAWRNPKYKPKARAATMEDPYTADQEEQLAGEGKAEESGDGQWTAPDAENPTTSAQHGSNWDWEDQGQQIEVAHFEAPCESYEVCHPQQPDGTYDQYGDQYHGALVGEEYDLPQEMPMQQHDLYGHEDNNDQEPLQYHQDSEYGRYDHANTHEHYSTSTTSRPIPDVSFQSDRPRQIAKVFMPSVEYGSSSRQLGLESSRRLQDDSEQYERYRPQYRVQDQDAAEPKQVLRSNLFQPRLSLGSLTATAENQREDVFGAVRGGDYGHGGNW